MGGGRRKPQAGVDRGGRAHRPEGGEAPKGPPRPRLLVGRAVGQRFQARRRLGSLRANFAAGARRSEGRARLAVANFVARLWRGRVVRDDLLGPSGEAEHASTS